MRPSASPRRIRGRPLISVILPLYNEGPVLFTLVDKIEDALARCECDYEIIFVDDGSTDDSPQIIDSLARQNPHVRAIHFSRNFGHQAALQAGLLHAAGDAVVIMDSDLQDDPAALPAFVEKWREGSDVVYAVRAGRKEGPLKRFLFFAFYRLLNAVSHTPIPRDAGNFGLVDRKVALRIAHLIDRDRYFPGLRRWVGFTQAGVVVERSARHDEQPRVSFRQLVGLAKTALFSFSTFPLAMFYVIAGVSLVVCGGLIGFALYHKLFTGLAIPGWTSMTITASFFGALNALGIAILGEYVVRIYDQVRARPQFIIDRKKGFAGSARRTVGQELEWTSDPWADASPHVVDEPEDALQPIERTFNDLSPR